MLHQLPTLPYEIDALEPHISAETLKYHHGKHHRGYINKLNKLIVGTRYENLSLEQIIVDARKNDDTAILNNAAQIWNHEFLWSSMTPNGGGTPDEGVQRLLDGTFKKVDAFKDAFGKAALAQFGSGWTWLVLEGNEPKIISTSNAATPVGTDLKPLLVLDVWEHAYYIDYRNDRAQYVDAFLEQLVNWSFAEQNLTKPRKVA